MHRYALRDEQWERIEGLLPGREGQVGVTAKDNRLFVEAVLYRYRAGIPWRDLPERCSSSWLSSACARRTSAPTSPPWYKGIVACRPTLAVT